MMRRLMNICLLAVCLTSLTGCALPIYSPLPERRVQQLLYTSEDMRMVIEEWERIWHLDQPSHMSPIRTHGGTM